MLSWALFTAEISEGFLLIITTTQHVDVIAVFHIYQSDIVSRCKLWKKGE